MSLINFLKIAIRDYWSVGALNPTSRSAARRLAGKMGPKHKFIVEYGAGNGALTREILKALPPDGRLIAIEINGRFVQELRKIKDNRLLIINDNVADTSRDLTKLGLPRIDAVISGIPFSYIGSETGREIIRNTYQYLAESGIFITYQNSLRILPWLKGLCNGNVLWYFEPRNFLPYFVMIAKK